MTKLETQAGMEKKVGESLGNGGSRRIAQHQWKERRQQAVSRGYWRGELLEPKAHRGLTLSQGCDRNVVNWTPVRILLTRKTKNECTGPDLIMAPLCPGPG